MCELDSDKLLEIEQGQLGLVEDLRRFRQSQGLSNLAFAISQLSFGEVLQFAAVVETQRKRMPADIDPSRVRRLVDFVREIAAYGDMQGNLYLAETGEYFGFDYGALTGRARKLLKKLELEPRNSSDVGQPPRPTPADS